MGTERFPKPDSENYNGALPILDVNSIKAFEPLDLTGNLGHLAKSQKAFPIASTNLDPTKIGEFTRKLKYIQR